MSDVPDAKTVQAIPAGGVLESAWLDGALYLRRPDSVECWSTDGRQLWRTPCDEGRARPAIATDGDHVIVAEGWRCVRALRRDTGREGWRRALEKPMLWPGPIPFAEGVGVLDGYTVLVLRSEDGAIAARIELPAPCRAVAQAGGLRVYAEASALRIERTDGPSQTCPIGDVTRLEQRAGVIAFVGTAAGEHVVGTAHSEAGINLSPLPGDPDSAGWRTVPLAPNEVAIHRLEGEELYLCDTAAGGVRWSYRPGVGQRCTGVALDRARIIVGGVGQDGRGWLRWLERRSGRPTDEVSIKGVPVDMDTGAPGWLLVRTLSRLLLFGDR